VAVENYNWQHQDLRTENGIKFGDTIENMDFPYLEKVTKLNVAALAAIASAPPPPEPLAEGAVSTDTTISWSTVKSSAGYRVYQRRTDANQWTPSPDGAHECLVFPTKPIRDAGCRQVLKGTRVDDWVFGVSTVGVDGFESPVASAVPGGAFRPWVAPPAEPVK
jgi:hypothetical protein